MSRLPEILPAQRIEARLLGAVGRDPELDEDLLQADRERPLGAQAAHVEGPVVVDDLLQVVAAVPAEEGARPGPGGVRERFDPLGQRLDQLGLDVGPDLLAQAEEEDADLVADEDAERSHRVLADAIPGRHAHAERRDLGERPEERVPEEGRERRVQRGRVGHGRTGSVPAFGHAQPDGTGPEGDRNRPRPLPEKSTAPPQLSPRSCR
jgi:hypothetical protein